MQSSALFLVNCRLRQIELDHVFQGIYNYHKQTLQNYKSWQYFSCLLTQRVANSPSSAMSNVLIRKMNGDLTVTDEAHKLSISHCGEDTAFRFVSTVTKTVLYKYLG